MAHMGGWWLFDDLIVQCVVVGALCYLCILNLAIRVIIGKVFVFAINIHNLISVR